MKNLIATITLVSALGPMAVNAQTINWQSMPDGQRHIANLNVGWDYAATLGVGYAYRMETKLPVLFNAQLSIPAGEDFADDLKTKLGMQVRVFKFGDFLGTVAAYGIYRKNHSELSTLQNFGSEFTAVAGYYRPRWFAAFEFGFDKAITTHIKHSDQMRQYYPLVRDGWYVPTGGNFMMALQTGYSFKVMDMYVKVGRVIDQYLKPTATVPLTFQFGVNVRF